jgi:hypothetical protein
MDLAADRTLQMKGPLLRHSNGKIQNKTERAKGQKIQTKTNRNSNVLKEIQRASNVV